MVDLSVLSDGMLQSTLDRLFLEHAEAADACDKQAQAECHHAIAEILGEQSRRLDAWIARHAEPVR